jgi:hypothetical protein
MAIEKKRGGRVRKNIASPVKLLFEKKYNKNILRKSEVMS